MRTNDISETDKILPFVLAAVAGTALFVVLGTHGVGVSTDSVVYLNVAENILKTGAMRVTAFGLDAPMTHFPPLYPALLALAASWGRCSVETAALVLNVTVFSANIALVGILASRMGLTGRGLAAVIIIFATSEYMVIVHAKALSEALFLVFLLSTILTVGWYAERGWTNLLLLSGGLAALACLQRYTGVALVAAVALFLASPSLERTLKKRLRDSVVFAAVALAPLALWMAGNAISAGSAADRRLAFHPIGLAHLRQLARSALFVILPDGSLAGIKVALSSPDAPFILVIASFVLSSAVLAVFFASLPHLKRREPFIMDFWNNSAPWFKVAAVFAGVYPLFLVASISLFDYTTPLSYRIMAPEFVAGLLVVAVALSSLASSWGRTGRLILETLAVALMVSYGFRCAALCANIHENGLEFSSVAWSESPLVAYVKKLSEDVPVYTNGAAGLYYQLKRSASAIPRKLKDGAPNPKLDLQLDVMKHDLDANNAVVVYFNDIPSTLLPNPEELASKLDLTITLKAKDGIVMTKKNREESSHE